MSNTGGEDLHPFDQPAEPAAEGADPTASQAPAEPATGDPLGDADAEPATEEQERPPQPQAQPTAPSEDGAQTVLGTVKMSLARGDRNVHLRLYGPLNDLLMSLGSGLRVEPGAYRNGEIRMSFVQRGGRAVERKNDHHAIEYRADPGLVAALSDLYARGRPVLADAVLSIRLRSPAGPAAVPAVALPPKELWIVEEEEDEARVACVVSNFGVSATLAIAASQLGGSWRLAAPGDDAAIERARATGDFLRREV
jgi:hypothetical protein